MECSARLRFEEELQAGESSGCSGNVMGIGKDRIIDGRKEKGEKLNYKWSSERLRGATGFEVGVEAPAEKLLWKFFFFFFFFPEMRKSFKEYQRKEKKIPSDGPEVFTPAIIHSFFFSLCGSAGRRGGKATCVNKLFVWFSGQLWLFF